MKISIKNIKGEIFVLNVEKDEKIIDIKNKIKSLKSSELETQKLIFKGQMTVDEKSVAEYDIKENDVLVLMITKKASNVENPAPPKQEEHKKNEPAPVPQPNVNVNNPNLPNALVMGEEYNKTVEEICKMGFTSDDVKKALSAAFNNPDRAIDYLINGIPNIPEGQYSQAAYGVQASAAGQGQVPQNPGQSQSMAALLQQVRNTLGNDPQALQNMLGELAQNDPQLLQAISANPEEFLRLMEQEGEGEGMEEEEDEEGIPIELTEEDNKAIERLCGLGFDKDSVIEAYLLCEKNEELTANYLFDNMNN